MRSGWVRRGGTLRTLSGPRGSSSKEDIPGAAGLPARSFRFKYTRQGFRNSLACHLPGDIFEISEIAR